MTCAKPLVQKVDKLKESAMGEPECAFFNYEVHTFQLVISL